MKNVKLHRNEPGNHLIVAVQDHTYNYCEDATVNVRMKNTKHWQTIPFDKNRNSYVKNNLQIGTYELKVLGKKGWISDERDIEIKEGTNSIYSSIAPADTFYYLASDNEKVFFQPNENVLLLWVFGNDRDRCVKEACKKSKIKIGNPIVTADEDVNQNGSQYFINLPESEEERKQLLDQLHNVVNEQLRTLGVTAHITLPIIKGKAIIEGLTNEFIVKFESHVTDNEVAKIAKHFGMDVVRTITYLGNAYLLRYGKFPSYKILKNLLDQKERLPIIWFEPNRIEPVTADIFSPNDFYTLNNRISH